MNKEIEKFCTKPFDEVGTTVGSSAIVARTFGAGSPALAILSLPGTFKTLFNFVWKLLAICSNSDKPSWCKRNIKTVKLISTNCSVDLYFVLNSGDFLLACVGYQCVKENLRKHLTCEINI